MKTRRIAPAIIATTLLIAQGCALLGLDREHKPTVKGPEPYRSQSIAALARGEEMLGLKCHDRLRWIVKAEVGQRYGNRYVQPGTRNGAWTSSAGASTWTTYWVKSIGTPEAADEVLHEAGEAVLQSNGIGGPIDRHNRMKAAGFWVP